MLSRALASAKVDCPEGREYAVLISSFSAAFFLSRSAADFLCLHRPLLFTPGDEIQDGLKIEKPRALHLARRADGHAAEVSLARAFIKFGAAESAVKFQAGFRRANPNGQAVGLIVE